jgi:hypothetical protein
VHKRDAALIGTAVWRGIDEARGVENRAGAHLVWFDAYASIVIYAALDSNQDLHGEAVCPIRGRNTSAREMEGWVRGSGPHRKKQYTSMVRTVARRSKALD